MVVDIKYNILFYCSSNSWGGLELGFLRFATWMQSRGHTITCCFVHGTPLYDGASRAGIPVRAIKRNRKYFDIVNALSVARIIRDKQFDVVWITDNRDISTLGWAHWVNRGSFKLLYQQAMQLGIDKKDFFHTARFRRIDAWLAPLQFLAQQVKERTRYPSSRVTVVPLAFDPSKFSGAISRTQARTALNLPASAMVMGVIGRFDRLKGQHLAIEAFNHLSQEFQHLHLIIVGESTRGEGNDYEMELRRRAKDSEAHNRINFYPFQENVEGIFNALDIFVLTSQGETFGLVTVEAMACGCAVVGTNSSGTPELLGHGQNGLLFEPGNPMQLAEQIRKLLKDEPLRIALQNSARRASTKYQKDVVCEAIEAVLHNLLPQ